MTKEQFEQKHNVRLIRKDQLWEMRLLNWFLSFTKAYADDAFLKIWWTTYFRPFQKVPIIAYAINDDPMDPSLWFDALRMHEVKHTDRMRTTRGRIKAALLLSTFWLPCGYSGIWWLERDPYAVSIKMGVITKERAAAYLRDYYFNPYPVDGMIAYWESKGL